MHNQIALSILLLFLSFTLPTACSTQKVDPNDYSISSEDEIKEKLTDEQYDVTMNDNTESAYPNEYFDLFEPEIYVDIITEEPLFFSREKYDPACGWPSFTKPIDPDVTTYIENTSFNITRIEVRSRVGDIHLVHVFDDEPKDHGYVDFVNIVE